MKAESPKPQARFTFHASRLLDWFATNARDLPWRHTLDPYAIWVSEIMLQQTQVKTVIPYFDRWMRELPTVESLANAPSERIHKLWEGLGYYTRVRNMQKSAQLIVQQHGGVFPREFGAVLALPGIGRYTAGAICSIAFNQPAPILDGNVIRVLTRVFGIRENPREQKANAHLWELAEQLVNTATGHQPRGRAALSSARRATHGSGETHVGKEGWRDEDIAPYLSRNVAGEMQLSGACSALNQSVMELGATVCAPKAPRCEDCPLRSQCVARRENLIEQLPNLGERVAATARRFIACIIEQDGAVLVRQRPIGMVNAQLWEFPNVEVPMQRSANRRRQALESELGVVLASMVPFATVKHTITRYRITLEAVRGRLNGSMPRTAAGQWIASSELDKLPFTSAHRRVLRLVLKGANDLAAG